MHYFSVGIMRQRYLHRIVTGINLVDIISEAIDSTNPINSHSILRYVEFVVIALVVRRLPIVLGILVSLVLMAEYLDLLFVITIYYHVLVQGSFVILRFYLIVN